MPITSPTAPPTEAPDLPGSEVKGVDSPSVVTASETVVESAKCRFRTSVCSSSYHFVNKLKVCGVVAGFHYYMNDIKYRKGRIMSIMTSHLLQ